MKKEYDFSKGTRAKFYKNNVQLRLPVFLDDDVFQFIREFARSRTTDTQTIVNKILRSNKKILRAL